MDYPPRTVYQELSGLRAHVKRTVGVLRRARRDELADDLEALLVYLDQRLLAGEQKLRSQPARTTAYRGRRR